MPVVDTFDAGNGSLDQRSFAGFVSSLPRHSAMKRDICGMAFPLASTMQLSLVRDRAFARRDDVPGRRSGRTCGTDRLIFGLPVIGAIGNHRTDVTTGTGYEFADDRCIGSVVIGELMDNNLIIIRIDRKVQFTPRPARFAVSGSCPLACAVEFQASVVDHNVDLSPAWTSDRTDINRSAPACQGRMIGHGQIKAHQSHKRAHKTLGLAQWKPSQSAEHQRCLDRQIGESALTAGRIPARWAPAFDRLSPNPHPDIAAQNQAAIIGAPNCHLIPGAWNVMTPRCVEFERHANLG